MKTAAKIKVKIWTGVFTALFLSAQLVKANLTDNQAEIKIEKNKISVTTKRGYHLNAEAPASATIDGFDDSAGNSLNDSAGHSIKSPKLTIKPSTKTEKLFVFNVDLDEEAKLKKNKNAETANISFYVCDDKKTVCEQHQHRVSFKTREIKKTETKPEYDNIKEISLKNENGKPTLLVFSAPWCPACIRMQTETYNQPEVKNQTAKLNFVKLNSDIPENYELSERFKVKAIPTLILLDKSGQEAYRWLDYQNAAVFAKSLAVELKKADLAANTIKNAQLGDPTAASALAFKAYNSLDFAEALKWFSLTKSEKDLKYKLAAEISLSQEKAEADTTIAKLTEDYLQTLQKAIVLSTSELDQIRWRLDFFEKKKELNMLTEEAKLKAKNIIAELSRLIKNPEGLKKLFSESTYGNYGGFEKEELLWMTSRLYKILEMTDEKNKTDKESANLIVKKKLSEARPGEMLLAIYYLRETGEIKKVEELYERLIKKYPASYVYFEKYARFVKKNNQFEKALSLTNEALKFPQGNEPQLNLLKSQILKDLNKKAEALATVEETFKIENIQHKRFAGTFKRLTELKAELTRLDKK